MIIDLVDKLLDRLIELAKFGKQVQKERFQSLVQEALVEFETIHSNYLQSFRSYRTRLADGGESVPAIIEAIREECLFTEHQRAKLREWSMLCAEHKQYGAFFDTIASYLTAVHDVESMTFGPDYFAPTGQRWFHGLVDALMALEQLTKKGHIARGTPIEIRNAAHEAFNMTKDERRAAIYLIDWFAGQLQTYFSIVSREYAELRKRSQ